MSVILCTLIKICTQLTHHLYLFLTSMTSLPLWSGLYQVDGHPSRFRQHSIGYHRLCRWTGKLCVFLGKKIYMKMIKLHDNTELPNSSYSKTSLNFRTIFSNNTSTFSFILIERYFNYKSFKRFEDWYLVDD